LEKVFGAVGKRSPTFQVPVAPGTGEERRRRRVVLGLLSVGSDESIEELRPRARRLLEREAAGGGLLSRVGAAAVGAPLPDFVRRRLLAPAARPRPLLPMVEVLSGRGCLSSLRFAPGEEPAAPLFAASSPGLGPTPADPRGGVVLTLIDHGGPCSASLCGTGLAARPGGARAFLDAWLELVA
jgi:hypothetical protein